MTAGRFSRGGAETRGKRSPNIKPEFDIAIVNCELSAGQFAKVEDLCPTQEITVKGLVYACEARAVHMSNCRVTDIGQDPSIEVTAVDITREYFEDESTAATKYGQKAIRLTATVAEIDVKEMAIQLEGYAPDDGEPVMISVGVGVEVDEIMDEVAVGDTVVVSGMGGQYFDNQRELSVYFGHVLEHK